MHSRLDLSSRASVAQDFRHASQRDSEPVSDFIRRLEQLFKLAYGRDLMGDETRKMLLHCQLQEGLRDDIMEAPAVSGSRGYQELCLATRNEEKRLAELAKRRRYHKTSVIPNLPQSGRPDSQFPRQTTNPADRSRNQPPKQSEDRDIGSRRCYSCGQLGHLAWECRSRRTESSGRGSFQRQRPGGAKQVRSDVRDPHTLHVGQDPASFLFSDSEESDSGVRQVRINDRGSHQQYANVQMEGVPAKGVIDSGADITIMGGDLFRRVAAAARLRKSQFMKADKVPRTYDRRSFTLDGKMELDISFGGVTMKTSVYIKMDTPEQLLLSEGVCRQLKIITYHPDMLGCKHGGDQEDGAAKKKPKAGEERSGPPEISTGRTDKESQSGVRSQATHDQGTDKESQSGVRSQATHDQDQLKAVEDDAVVPDRKVVTTATQTMEEATAIHTVAATCKCSCPDSDGGNRPLI